MSGRKKAGCHVSTAAGCRITGSGEFAYTAPWAIMASATFRKPAMLAPET